MSTRPTTKDQKLYTVDGQLKAEIDVYLTREDVEDRLRSPSIADCRHAVLQIKNRSKRNAYVVYDRLLCRIVNGVFYGSLAGVLSAAQGYNEYPDSPQDMVPNGLALGLVYPKGKISEAGE